MMTFWLSILIVPFEQSLLFLLQVCQIKIKKYFLLDLALALA